MGVVILFLLFTNSPAVDAGSDDAYGYDSTSTNTKEIDMSRPDVGYHYYRRIADDDDPDGVGEDAQEIKISFKPPKEEEVEIIQFPMRVVGQGEEFLIHDHVAGAGVALPCHAYWGCTPLTE